MAEIMIFKKSTLRQLILFFSFSYLFTYIHSSWIKITSTYFCLLGVYFFMPVILEISFTFVPDSLVKSWKKRLLTVVIDTETEYHIKYITLANGPRLHDEDREITLRTETTDITTEVFRSDRNSEREHCLNVKSKGLQPLRLHISIFYVWHTSSESYATGTSWILPSLLVIRWS